MGTGTAGTDAARGVSLGGGTACHNAIKGAVWRHASGRREKLMKYTVILTEGADGSIHVTVPGLPDCTVEAKTRREALNMIRENITTIMSRSEIIQLDVPAEPKLGKLYSDTPWEWFGAFKDDPAWGELFDKIENQRNGDQD